MAKPFSKQFYKSKAWVKTSKAYKASVAGLCERCLAKGIIKPAEIVHHKIELTPENIHNPDIALGWDNLQAVCRDCHAELHGLKASRDCQRWSIDESGRVVITEHPS